MPPQIPAGEVQLVGLLSPSLHMHGPQASQVHHTLHLLHKPWACYFVRGSVLKTSHRLANIRNEGTNA